MIRHWLCKRPTREKLITGLLHENANLRAMLKAEQGVSEETRQLHEALVRWLGARIAYFAVNPHIILPAVALSPEVHALFVATEDVERVARGCFLTPGMKGSWGRGVPRAWACDFDPKGGGCECAGGGMTDAECRHCFYRRPMGEKDAPCTLDRAFDSRGGGCRCAPGGLTDANRKTCFHWHPVGEKKED